LRKQLALAGRSGKLNVRSYYCSSITVVLCSSLADEMKILYVQKRKSSTCKNEQPLILFKLYQMKIKVNISNENPMKIPNKKSQEIAKKKIPNKKSQEIPKKKIREKTEEHGCRI
jgi:hypothetical protein